MLDQMHALECLLLWEGSLRRSRVMELFGLKNTRASLAIRQFCASHTGWAELNTLTRAHEATPRAWREGMSRLSPHERAASFAQYLALTNAPMASNVEREDGILWAAFPELSVPDPADFAAVYRAINRGYALDIVYRSLANPEPHARTIRPHGVVRAGRRWHVRAWCVEVGQFRDFTFGRMSEIRPSKTKVEVGASSDEAWNTRVEIEVIAHPGLTLAQQRMVQREYFGAVAALRVRCRACLVPYYVREIDASIDPERQRAPEHLLAIGNAAEISRWLMP